MKSCESQSEGAVGGCYGDNRGVIAGSGDGNVGYSVNGFLLIELRCILFLQDIGGVEFGTGGGALRFAPLVVRSGKESFEAGSIFLLCRETFPGFAFIDKNPGLVDELEGNSNELFEAVGSVTVSGVVTAIFDPVEKRFNQLVYIIRGAEDSVFFMHINGGYVGVGGVQVIQDGTGGGGPYPKYLCQRERTKISSTVERRICRRALSVRSYLLKSAEAVSKS